MKICVESSNDKTEIYKQIEWNWMPWLNCNEYRYLKIRNEMEIEIKVESNSLKSRYLKKRERIIYDRSSYPLCRGKWKTKKHPDLVTGLILGRDGEQWSR